MSLKSIHQITDKALSPEAQVEDCIRGILDAFNGDPDHFKENLPVDPCGDQVALVKVNSETLPDGDQRAAVADIRERFKCLYYSYAASSSGASADFPELDPGDLSILIYGPFTEFLRLPYTFCRPCRLLCVNNPIIKEIKRVLYTTKNMTYPEEDLCINTVPFFALLSGISEESWRYYTIQTEQTTWLKNIGPYCSIWDYSFENKPLFQPASEDKIEGGSIFKSTFDYTFPAYLPSRAERFKKGWMFTIDVYLTFDLTAENFIIDVFEEFMGCAVSKSASNYADG